MASVFVACPMSSKILFAMLLFPLFRYLVLEKGVAIAEVLAKSARNKFEVFIVGMKFGR